MKKSTKIRFCTVPKGTDCKILRCKGKAIWNTDITDKIVDEISNPYIQIALESLGWLNRVDILSEETVTTSVYVVTQRDIMDMSYDIIMDVLIHAIPYTTSAVTPTEIAEMFEIVYGIQYMLSIKSQLGIDVCIVEGNTIDDLREEN